MSTENGPKSVATEGPKNQENPKPWKKRTKIIPRGGPKHQTQDEEETAIRKRRRGRRRKKKKKKKWRITHKIPTAQKVFAKHRSSEDANDVEEEEEEDFGDVCWKLLVLFVNFAENEAESKKILVGGVNFLVGGVNFPGVGSEK